MNIKTFNEKYIGRYYFVFINSTTYNVVEDTEERKIVAHLDLESYIIESMEPISFGVWSDIRRVLRKLKSNRRIR